MAPGSLRSKRRLPGGVTRAPATTHQGRGRARARADRPAPAPSVRARSTGGLLGAVRGGAAAAVAVPAPAGGGPVACSPRRHAPPCPAAPASTGVPAELTSPAAPLQLSTGPSPGTRSRTAARRPQDEDRHRLSTPPERQHRGRTPSALLASPRGLLGDAWGGLVVAALWLLAGVPASAAPAPDPGGNEPATVAALAPSDLLSPSPLRADHRGAATRLRTPPDREAPSGDSRATSRRHPGVLHPMHPGPVHAFGTDRPLTLRDLSVAVHPDRAHAPPSSA